MYCRLSNFLLACLLVCLSRRPFVGSSSRSSMIVVIVARVDEFIYSLAYGNARCMIVHSAKLLLLLRVLFCQACDSTFKHVQHSTFQYFNISTFQYFNISIFQHFNISTLKCFNISTLKHVQYFNISTFQHSYYYTNDSQHSTLISTFNIEDCE